MCHLLQNSVVFFQHDALLMDHFLVEMWEYEVALLGTEDPLRGQIKLSGAQLVVGTFGELELTVNEVLSEFVENTRVNNSHTHAIHSQVVSQQNVEAIVHHSESHSAQCIATVLQICFEEIDLTKMFDRILRREHLERNCGLRRGDETELTRRSFFIMVDFQTCIVRHTLGVLR